MWETYDLVEKDGARHENILPTPLLLSEGTRPGVWLEVTRMDGLSSRGQEIWRVHDQHSEAGAEILTARVEVIAPKEDYF